VEITKIIECDEINVVNEESSKIVFLAAEFMKE
jgi:hypothetical protein